MIMPSFQDKIIITGAAGLVGQNLVSLLIEQGYSNLVAIDKHKKNLEILQNLHPNVQTSLSDLAEKGEWESLFKDSHVIFQLHAQITGTTLDIFERNNIAATKNVLNACHKFNVPYMIHASSSVVNSVAKDHYTNTKKIQESLVKQSGIHHCILRPTLMFGWFDPKHLGWLSRFMEKTPIFPIPGHGRYMRQPLYNRDFCRAMISCMERKPKDEIFDLVGPEKINYIDIIRAIKKAKKLKTMIVNIPYNAFYFLLKIYSRVDKHPPFTADQLEALTAGDSFEGVDMEKTFGFSPTPFYKAMDETFNHPKYSIIVLER